MTDGKEQVEITGGLSEEEVAEIIAGFGGIEAMKERTRRFEAVSARLYAQKDELRAAYPDHWVILIEDGRMFICATLDEYRKTVQRDDLAGTVRAVDFLDSEPGRRIL